MITLKAGFKNLSMRKIFLDTSIFIRYLTQDSQEKYTVCSLLIDQIQTGTIKPYISNIVILETFFVLNRTYRFPRETILAMIDDMLALRNLTLIEVTKTKPALKLYQQHKIKFPDCLIVTQIPGGVTLVSYDHEFSKITSLSLATPDAIIKGFNSII